MFGPAGSRFKGLPVRTLIPNTMTVLAMCAGLTSMRVALQQRWELAVALILIAALIDGLDGRIARLLKATSRFGAELDSLSDFVCFGVAPVFFLYQWSLNELGGLGWIAVLIYAICCAFRLARFNTASFGDDTPAWQAQFFTGVSSPAGAGLSILFPVLSFEAGDWFFRSSLLNLVWVVFIATLMVSRVPTFSFKKLRIRRELGFPILLAVALLGGMLISFPWYTLAFVGILYLATIPLAYRAYLRLLRPSAPAPSAEMSTAMPNLPDTKEAGGDDVVLH